MENELSKMKYGINDVLTTKEIAEQLSISTPTAYKKMIELEKQGYVYRYGYMVRGGWEDVDNSNLRTNSIGWQRIK